MARIDSGPVYNTFKHDGIEYEIRNTEEFENESFGFPKNQKLPTDRYEVKHFNIIGAIASGKSTLADRYYAYRIWQQWGDAVDFFKVDDLYATIEAIKKSEKHVHFIILDDFISKLDSRRSMSSENVDMTEFYYEIRHELARHAKISGGNAGGLVIMAILTQDHKAIDKRLRESAMFNVFKTYDHACDDLIPDPEIISLLKQLKDKSVRICDYNFRKLAVAIDTMEKYTLFYVDRDGLPKIPFETVSGDSIYKQHRDYLISYLMTNFDLSKMSKDAIKAELFFKIDKIEESGVRCRINKSDFTELITRTTRLQEIDYNKYQLEQQFNSQKDQILGYAVECSSCRNMQLYTPRNLGEIPLKPHTICKICETDFQFNKTDLKEIKKSQIFDFFRR